MTAPAETQQQLRARLRLLLSQGDWQGIRHATGPALATWPEDLGLTELAANAALKTGHPTEALPLLWKLLARAPEHPGVMHQLAIAYLELKQPEPAGALLGQALARAPGDSLLHYTEGRLNEQRGQAEAAIRSYRKALVLRAEFPEACVNLALLLCRAGELAEAELLLGRALALRPDWPQALCNLSGVLLKQGRHSEALESARSALALKPDSTEARLQAGTALRAQRDYPAAELQLRSALEAGGVTGQSARLVLAAMLDNLQRFEESRALLEEILEAHPEAPTALLYRGLQQLRLEQLPAGWAGHERRFDPQVMNAIRANPGFEPPDVPRWAGQSLLGRRILVVPEQGFGDQLQFFRFAPVLRELGAAAVGICCTRSLARLMRSLVGVDTVLSPEEVTTTGDWDYFVAVMSLPFHLGVDLERLVTRHPYLSASAASVEVWRSRLPAGRLRVGLNWRGRPSHYNDAHRSSSIEAFSAGLAQVGRAVTWVNLQHDIRPDELAAADQAGLPLTDFSHELADFADTAGLIQALDLVITIDSAVAHLCGALGQQALVLLPFIGCDWRWFANRSDSPWYPGNLQLLRQSARDDWSQPLALARKTLLALGSRG